MNFLFMNQVMTEEQVESYIEKNSKDYQATLNVFYKDTANFFKKTKKDKELLKKVHQAFQFIEDIKTFAKEKSDLMISLNQKYQNANSKELKNAKEEVKTNLPTILTLFKEDKEDQAINALFACKAFVEYFQSFKFNMTNGHHGNDEYTNDKNISVSFNPEDQFSLNMMFLRNYQESIHKNIKSLIKNEITEQQIDWLIDKIFLPQIEMGCAFCSNSDDLTFNHEKQTVETFQKIKCSYENQDGVNFNSYKARIVIPTGKLVLFANGSAELNKTTRSENMYNLFKKSAFPSIELSYNTIVGQRAIANLFANTLNIGITTNAEGLIAMDKTSNGNYLFGHPSDKNNTPSIQSSHWLNVIADWDYAKAAFETENKGKKKAKKFEDCEFIVFDVEPGTYDMETLLEEDPVSETPVSNKLSDISFTLRKVSDITEFTPMDKKSLKEYMKIQ